MFLYLVERTDEIDYDEHDAVVLRAESHTRALEMATTLITVHRIARPAYDGFRPDGSNLRVTVIGAACLGDEEGEVLSSFNAG